MMLRGLFLIPILHQTTTLCPAVWDDNCCFSFQFYIKPQQTASRCVARAVVSHSNSTSNHNISRYRAKALEVVSHSNSTSNHDICFQRRKGTQVVSHSNSTSNHNATAAPTLDGGVVSHSNSTSNHNLAHGSNSYSARYTYDTDA